MIYAQLVVETLGGTQRISPPPQRWPRHFKALGIRTPYYIAARFSFSLFLSISPSLPFPGESITPIIWLAISLSFLQRVARQNDRPLRYTTCCARYSARRAGMLHKSNRERARAPASRISAGRWRCNSLVEPK